MAQIRLPESIGVLTKTSTTTLSLAPSIINIGGQQYRNILPLTLSSTVIGIGGVDVILPGWKLIYIYAVLNNGQLGIIASANSSGPIGFNTSRFVGYSDTDGSSLFLAASNKLIGTVGDHKSAYISESQFQAQNGPGWILADGRDVSGSAFSSLYGNLAPDARGLVLRGRNDGGSTLGTRADGKQNPDGTLALGAFQDHSFSSHQHGGATGVRNLNHTHNYSAPHNSASVTNQGGGAFGAAIQGTDNLTTNSNNADNENLYHSHVINSEGGNETRMRNITVNHFIKVN